MFPGDNMFFGAMALLNFVWIIPLALVGLAVPYVTARMRERTGQLDPHIGVKTAHWFFFTTGIFLMLSGLTFICVELMEIDNRPRGGAFMGVRAPFTEAPAVRIGLALIITGGIFALLHRLLLLTTNDAQMPQVRRAFAGLRFIVSGLVVLISMAVFLSILLQVRSEFSQIKPLLGVMIVWVPSWFLHLAFLLITTPRATSDVRDARPPSPEQFYDD